MTKLIEYLKVNKKLSMIDGVLNFPTEECKRWLDLEGRHGAKSNRNRNERESGRAIFSKCIIL